MFMLPVGEITLVASYTRGEPLSLCVASDEKSLFVAEGAQLVELALRPDASLVELRSCRLDASPLDLEWTDECIWMAGGAGGLWRIPSGAVQLRPEPIALVAGQLCVGVASHGQLLVAAFACQDASTIRSYRADTGKELASLELKGVRAEGIDLHKGQVMLALGTHGARSLDISPDGQFSLHGNSQPLSLDPKNALAHVASVALTSDLACAATGSWLAAGAAVFPRENAQALATMGVHHGVAVDARGDRWVMATMRAPAWVLDWAPFGQLGCMGVDLTPGGGADQKFIQGATGKRPDRLILGKLGSDEPIASAILQPTGWRDLVLGRQKIYTLRLLHGLEIWQTSDDKIKRIAQRKPRGAFATDALVSPIDPSVIFSGRDAGAVLPTGPLHLAGKQLQPVADSWDCPPLGICMGTPFFDDQGTAWLLAGQGFQPRLMRLDFEQGTSCLHWWNLQLPPSGQGNGHTYFHSTPIGERIALLRAGTDQGLLWFDPAALTQAARSAEPRSTLKVAPIATNRTHLEGSAELPVSLRGAELKRADAPPLFVIAAGAASNNLESPARAQLVVVDPGCEPPRVLARQLLGDQAGLAFAIDAALIGDLPLALVGDLNGRITALDLSDPLKPRDMAHWTAPPNDWDGTHHSIIDLAVLRQDESGVDLVAAAGRMGMVWLRFDRTGSTLQLVQTLDTPGWATGVFVDREGCTESQRRVLLSDQRCGLRVLRLEL